MRKVEIITVFRFILGLLPILAPIFFSCPNSPHFQIYAHIRLVAFVTAHIRPPTSGLDSVSAYFLLNPRIQHICMAVDLYSPIILVYGPRGHRLTYLVCAVYDCRLLPTEMQYSRYAPENTKNLDHIPK